jgi:hypothetical protein
VFEPDPRRHRLYNERFARYGLLYPFMQSLRKDSLLKPQG